MLAATSRKALGLLVRAAGLQVGPLVNGCLRKGAIAQCWQPQPQAGKRFGCCSGRRGCRWGLSRLLSTLRWLTGHWWPCIITSSGGPNGQGVGATNGSNLGHNGHSSFASPPWAAPTITSSWHSAPTNLPPFGPSPSKMEVHQQAPSCCLSGLLPNTMDESSGDC